MGKAASFSFFLSFFLSACHFLPTITLDKNPEIELVQRLLKEKRKEKHERFK